MQGILREVIYEDLLHKTSSADVCGGQRLQDGIDGLFDAIGGSGEVVRQDDEGHGATIARGGITAEGTDVFERAGLGHHGRILQAKPERRLFFAAGRQRRRGRAADSAPVARNLHPRH